MKIQSLLIIISIALGLSVDAQQDFNNYKTLKSEGPMPDDFSMLTSVKIQQQQGTKADNLSKMEEKIFLEGIYYGIDELLHSGMVIYGDEISKYVSEISLKVLKEKYPDLKDKLRFYTIKSNESNALSTDQGIVFVTTGLISQLANEAQLAFVLAHEISHYTEHHVIETFEYKSHMEGQGDRIRQLSIYAKDKEFEADKLGVSLYHSAGYSKVELLPTFDVLMYSYLPFDEIEFPKNYYNNSLMYVPEDLYPSKKYEIKAEEDYDDSRSSHPNIKNRKLEVEKEIEKFENWGTEVYAFGKERFLYIRNLSRFESIRTDILDAQYADAMYSIFLLEKEVPNSVYLKRMKAHSWLGLAQYKNAGSINETVDRASDFEGEIAALHYFIKKLKNEATSTVALREIQNIRTGLKGDVEIDAIWDRMVKLVASSKSFDLKKFSDKTFETASKDFLKVLTKDTMAITSTVPEDKLNKYERIKSKKNNTDPTTFDTSKFYLYALTDLVKDEEFTKKYEAIKDSIKKKEKKEEELVESYSEVKIDNSVPLKPELTDFILVEPSAISYKKGKISYPSSDKLEKKYTEAINSVGEELDLSIYNLNSDKLKDLGTVGFNERSVLTSFLSQMTHNEKVDILPVDFEYLREIEANYGTSKVVYTIVEHSYSPRFSSSALWLIFYPPALMGYLPIPFMRGNQTELNLILVDSQKAKIENGVSYYFREPTNLYVLKARMYDILLNMKVEK